MPQLPEAKRPRTLMRNAQELDIAGLDLNLLKVFLALIDEDSATAAGERLDMAQSSVSHCLARLRKTLGDPLFVRSRQGFQPTEVALALREPIAQALDLIQGALRRYQDFNPTASTRTFNVLMTDAGEMFFAPALVARLRAVAPSIRLVMHQLPRRQYRDALGDGVADIAIGQLPRDQPDLIQQHLFAEGFAGFARKGHFILDRPTVESYVAAEHLVVGTPAVAEAQVQSALEALGLQRKVVVELSHYLSAPFILAQSDLVATLPTTFAKFAAEVGNLQRFQPPFPIRPIRFHQFWHARSTNDAGCRWLRGQVAALFAGTDRSA
jgi:DNA-binding transcriptional LysR family regulator